MPMQIFQILTLAALFAAVPCVTVQAAPLIGINVDASGDSVTDTRFVLSSSYVDAVTSAGGIPLLLPPGIDTDAVARYVELCDGFVFTGGRDITPSRYGDEMSTHTNLVNPRRENFDFALIEAALAAKKPILGVCLGAQELNVALGGSMIQDLPTETSSTVNHRPGGGDMYAHEIQITTGTRLQDITGTTTLEVNSSHHQACDRLGSGVLVMARAPDGVVESFQVENQPFAMGVQWHPEHLTSAPEHLAIYEALVRAADKK